MRVRVPVKLAVLFGATLLMQFAAAAPRPEYLFDEGRHWAVSKSEIDRRVRRIALAGIKVYVPTIWYGNGTHYPSRVAPWNKRLPDLDRFDPLRYLVARGREYGVAIHPMLTMARRGHGDLGRFMEPGVPEDAYNVHDPEFRALLLSIVEELLADYPLHGLNLDYIRVMGVCTSERCRASYARQTGADLQADLAASKRDASARKRIQRWQSAPISALVQGVHQLRQRLAPAARISIAMHSGTDIEPNMEGRTPAYWLNQGWVDLAFDMQYTPQVNWRTGARFREQLKHADGHAVLMANYHNLLGREYPKSGRDLLRDSAAVTARWPAATQGLYLFNLLSDEQVQALRNIGQQP